MADEIRHFVCRDIQNVNLGKLAAQILRKSRQIEAFWLGLYRFFRPEQAVRVVIALSRMRGKAVNKRQR